MMGVYIKGMEMPDMAQAYTGLIIGWDGKVYPFIPPQGHKLGESVATAVPVPPHGRLIDADALMQHEVLLPMDGGHLPIVYVSYVRNAPTIIPAEEEV